MRSQLIKQKKFEEYQSMVARLYPEYNSEKAGEMSTMSITM